MSCSSKRLITARSSSSCKWCVGAYQDETPTSTYVEVIGRVSRSGDTITQHAMLPLGDSLDMALVDHLVKLAPQFPSLFAE